MDKLKEYTDINEKLYVDSYFRLLKSNDSNLSETANVLRDLTRQMNIHCINQNLSKSETEKLKSETVTEYFNIVDSVTQPDLLPVINDCEITKDISLTTGIKAGHKLIGDLQEIKLYLNNLKINLPSSSKIVSNVSPKKNKASTYSLIASNATSKQNVFRPQSNFSILSNKRQKMSTEREDSNTGYSKKRYNKIHNQQKTIPASEPPKTPGFMSASSMYRNPLKKSEGKMTDNKTDETMADNKDCQLSNHESLKHFDKKIVDVIFNEIMDFSPNIKWTDIAGLEFVKTTVQEIVIWPLLRPDIFTGLRAPPRGILLFGPPGTGKTLIGKCIATESNSTFFCISASSLASKWVGESEQLVRALFTVAHLNQPAVIFIDEIDSLLSQRSDKDQDFTRKLKTEFLVQFDGAKTNSEERILVVGATNRPHELDEAARRRFVKRLYVPLPDEAARRQIIQKLLEAHQHNLSDSDMQRICDETKGYSGSDVAHLCKEAAMGPIRCIGPENIRTVSLDQVRSILLIDFLDALRQVRASVAQDDLNYYLEWNKKFGSFGVAE